MFEMMGSLVTCRTLKRHQRCEVPDQFQSLGLPSGWSCLMGAAWLKLLKPLGVDETKQPNLVG